MLRKVLQIPVLVSVLFPYILCELVQMLGMTFSMRYITLACASACGLALASPVRVVANWQARVPFNWYFVYLVQIFPCEGVKFHFDNERIVLACPDTFQHCSRLRCLSVGEDLLSVCLLALVVGPKGCNPSASHLVFAPGPVM